MSAARASIVAVVLAVLVLAATLGWYLFDRDRKLAGQDAARLAQSRQQEPSPPAPVAAVPAQEPRKPDPSAAAPGTAMPSEPAPGATASAQSSAGSSDPTRNDPAATVRADTDPAAKAPGDQPASGVAPSFDVVRVEPTGESVIAGRATPGATVDLMRDGQPLARVMADDSGLFALVPPALPPGTHEIVLQTIAPDGTRARSGQSVTVVIAAGGAQPPLVTVTVPGQPVVVLSRPDESGSGGVKSADAGAKPPAAPGGADVSGAAKQPASPAPRPAIRIASVEAEGGSLLVSGFAAPGATVRLYLNDALVAPGATDSAGRMSFAIGRGVRPGEYRVRLDDIDPVTGAVRSRAEVPFSVPEPVVVASNPLPLSNPTSTPAANPTSGATPNPGATPRTAAGPVPGASPSVALAPAGSEPAIPSPPASSNAAPATSAGGPAPDRQPGASTRVASAPKSASDAAIPGFGSARTDPGQVIVPEVNTTIVSRGDNLWRISKRTYGEGLRYTVIFGANAPQIRNPDLIYPGQIFVLPADQAGSTR